MSEEAINIILDALWVVGNDSYPTWEGTEEGFFTLRDSSVADAWDDIDPAGEMTEAILTKMNEFFQMANTWSTYREEVDPIIADLRRVQYRGETYSVIRDAWINSTNSVESIEA